MTVNLKSIYTFLVFLILFASVPVCCADDLWNDLFGYFDSPPITADLGVWSFHYTDAGDPDTCNTYLDYDTHYDNHLGVWSLGGTDPAVGANLTDTDIIVWNDNTMPPRGIYIHPSPDRFSMIKWTSQMEGKIDFTYRFWDMDNNCGDGVQIRILHNGSQIFGDTFPNGGDTSEMDILNFNIAIGDEIVFVVGPGNAGDYGCDATHLSVVITDVTPSTPTPSPQTTSTPTSQPTTSPTPTECSSTRVDMEMPQKVYHSGDLCWCRAVVCVHEPLPYDPIPLFVILDVYGNYFFAPDFSEFNYFERSFPMGSTRIDVLPEFQWPANVGSATGIKWYGALTDPTVSQIVGDLGMFTFGWSN